MNRGGIFVGLQLMFDCVFRQFFFWGGGVLLSFIRKGNRRNMTFDTELLSTLNVPRN